MAAAHRPRRRACRSDAVKILAPLAKSDEVEPLIAAGAHEFYCGITPPGWADLFGGAWVHRRNPRTGVADVADLERSIALAGDRPVYVTLNAASYPAGAVPLLVRFGHTLVEELGVAALIVGDVELLLALVAAGLAAHIHVSSLASCRNAGAAAFYRDLGVARVILPRHVSLREIEQVATAGIPIEVFALNDGCAFEEGTCATTHAYGAFCIEDRLEGKLAPLSERYEFWKWTLDNCGSQTSRGYTLGPCGLCALPRLMRAGIASVKVVGREASCARKTASVRLAAIALQHAQGRRRAGSDPRRRDRRAWRAGALCRTPISAITRTSGAARMRRPPRPECTANGESSVCTPCTATRHVLKGPRRVSNRRRNGRRVPGLRHGEGARALRWSSSRPGARARRAVRCSACAAPPCPSPLRWSARPSSMRSRRAVNSASFRRLQGRWWHSACSMWRSPPFRPACTRASRRTCSRACVRRCSGVASMRRSSGSRAFVRAIS